MFGKFLGLLKKVLESREIVVKKTGLENPFRNFLFYGSLLHRFWYFSIRMHPAWPCNEYSQVSVKLMGTSFIDTSLTDT